jgi:hypothetical protein
LGDAAADGYPYMGNVYQIVYSGEQEPPEVSEIDSWISTYMLTANVLIPESASEALIALERRECAYIVETGCMTIQWKKCGSSGAADTLDQLQIALETGG